MMPGLKRWVQIHAPIPLVVALGVSILVESTLGGLPAVLPWSIGKELLWGLLLPLVTIALCVTMLHSGFGTLERAHRRRWIAPRILWCLFVGALALTPALWSNDGLEVSGSVRNRLLLYALACLSTLIIPVTLCILVPSTVMLTSLLLAGASPSGLPIVDLVAPVADTAEMLMVSGLTVIAVFAYGFTYPPRWAQSAR